MQVVVLNLPEVERGIEKALKSYQRQIVDACAEAVDETAQNVIDESNVLAPVDTGALVDSSHKDDSPEMTDHSAEEQIGYNARYAAHVHEYMQGKKPKFLEKAVMNVGPTLRENVVKELKS
jgi:hypothetical protein